MEEKVQRSSLPFPDFYRFMPCRVQATWVKLCPDPFGAPHHLRSGQRRPDDLNILVALLYAKEKLTFANT